MQRGTGWHRACMIEEPNAPATPAPAGGGARRRPRCRFRSRSEPPLHLVALDLAGRAAREILERDETDLLRPLVARELLAAQGVEAGVINMSTIKPLDTEAVLAAARHSKLIVTAEEHQTHGGLGTAVARVLAETLPTPISFVGVDRYGTSGKWDELLKYFELTPDRLVAAAKDVIARKR